MPDDRGDHRQDRLEREINEILSNIDRFPTPAERRARASKRALQQFGDAVAERQRAFMRWLSDVSLSQLMLLSFLMILGSLFIRRVAPIAWPWLLYAGIVLFLATFTLMVFGGGRGGGSRGAEHYWRGRRMSYEEPSLALRIRQWWARHVRS